VEAVAKKLRELNPGFDGKVVPVIENGVVTELRFSADNVMDISPVRALAGLRDLDCSSFDGSGKLVDLSPLKDMKLEVLNCSGTQVSDLTPLKGMPLMHLYCGATQVSDLTPLEGMPLVVLYCGGTQVSDLTPLKGMPLTILDCGRTKVSDLTPLQGMNLNLFSFTPKNITKGLDVIRQMKSIQSIGLDSDNRFHPDDFWKKYDAGEFSK
jgi:Leucine-rich repeat (LRR) protein